jgi:hypothetical protein
MVTTMAHKLVQLLYFRTAWSYVRKKAHIFEDSLPFARNATILPSGGLVGAKITVKRPR